jgi:hypothetical protein
MWLIAMLFACNGGNKDSAADCTFDGDLDGLGADTGNLPSVYGAWTTTFGSRSYYDECEIEGLNRNAFDWINGGAMEIGGRVDNVRATLASATDADLHVVMSNQGGVTISGTYTFRGQELHIALGGLLFENAQLGVSEIEGHGYMGIDTNGDGSIDCGIMGDFNAKSSS